MTEETLLLRQIHPSFIQQGRVTSQAFRPTPKDNDLLSVYNNDLISPEMAWEYYTTELSLDSVGVLAVSLGEVQGQELVATSDPEIHPAHTVINFSGLGSKQIEKKGKRLKHFADSRGWQFKAE